MKKSCGIQSEQIKILNEVAC